MSDQEYIPISAVMISRDAEATIGAALESLRRFDEVVVYENGSTDRTAEIARGFTNVSLHQGEFEGFGPTKNRAAGLARNDWIFSIDSDEQVSPELLDSLSRVDLSNADVAYRVLRINYLRGRRVRFSGWGGDWLVRLYNRTATGLTEVPVHEVVQVPAGGRAVRLSGGLRHETARELSELLVKIDRYSELRRSHPKRPISPPLIFMRSFWAFLRVYLLQLGFLDGWRGLVIAVSEANGVFFKYMKPYVDRVEPGD